MQVLQRLYTQHRLVLGGSCFSFVLLATCFLLSIQLFAAQPIPPNSANSPAPPNNLGNSDKSLQKGPSVDQVSPTYRAPEKDPFSDPSLLRPKGAPAEPVAYPSLAERQSQWRMRRSNSLSQGLALPEETEQYIVGELEVKGVFVNAQAVGAFLKIQNTSITIFVKEGSKFWNGAVKKIDKGTRRDMQKGSVAGAVICTETTLYSDKTSKTMERSLPYVPR